MRRWCTLTASVPAPMQLFLVRHAIAVASAPDHPDATRPLTEKGRSKFVQAVRGARALGWRIDHLFASPAFTAVTGEVVLDEPLPIEGTEFNYSDHFGWATTFRRADP